MAAGFGYEPDELAKIQREFRSIQQRMGEMSEQTGRIKAVMTKAVATDLAAGALGNVIGFGVVVAQVRERVDAIQQQMAALERTRNQLAKDLATDVDRLGTVARQYAEAERRAREGVGKPGRGAHPGQPADPKKPGGGKPAPAPTGPGKHAPMPSGPKQPTGGGHGGHGGHGGTGGDPNPAVSHEGAIKVAEVTFDGKGKYKSGEAACREYIAQALDAMGVTDPAARAAWTKGMLTIVDRESSYNSPDWQVNRDQAHDVNVKGPIQSDGAERDCSRGGWQTIPGTFAKYHVKGTSTDIYDPVANCAASMQYVMARYGVSADGHDLAAKVQQADPSRPRHWY
ncbi:hypothetical protein HUT16_05040 [Kitasatospora sp. NA04385]|uniref:hypothetical protein n=1 Tax=Kitasatospora sp. NA04385 TaxID=2742135 RepID=UPI001591F539|nr:hypothetical protein [Kitasatospora sp. NA04385]QKW18516.1 hypothetical protein HUT16_05040 [Kitasatospora sp. NA04385]